MGEFFEYVTSCIDALARYPRVEVFLVFGFSLLIPVVGLACIYVRDHLRNGRGAPK